MMWLTPESQSYAYVLKYLIPCGVMIKLSWQMAAVQSHAVSRWQETAAAALEAPRTLAAWGEEQFT
jgi:hypothetical protein